MVDVCISEGLDEVSIPFPDSAPWAEILVGSISIVVGVHAVPWIDFRENGLTTG
jgi:hypothetical protein